MDQAVIDRFGTVRARITGLGLRRRIAVLALLMAYGYTTHAIAIHMRITENTVYTYRKRLYKMLGVHSDGEAIAFLHGYSPVELGAILATEEQGVAAGPVNESGTDMSNQALTVVV